MRHHGHFAAEWGPMRWFKRGQMKFAVLEALREGPKHGYEIIKHLEGKYGGLYSPSPGAIYPTLQMLEDLGYVQSATHEGKRVYEITAEGLAFLEAGDTQTPDQWPHGPFGWAKREMEDDLRVFWREFKELSLIIAHSVRAASHNREKLRQVRDVVGQAKKDIYRILSEEETTK